MNKLDKWMEEHEPLSEPLTKTEIQSLKKKVLSKATPKKKPYRLILALAAAMCFLVACGAVAIGLFDSMSDVNQTTKMVEKYSLALENPPSVTADGHTVTVQAIIRSDTIARVIYDVSGSKRAIRAWNSFKDAEGDVALRVQFLTNGQPSGHTDNAPGNEEVGYHQVRLAGPIGKVEDSDSIRYFADLDLAENADSISLYLLYEAGGAEVLQLELPDPIPEKELTLEDVSLDLKTKASDLTCTIQSVKITPFRLILNGTHSGELYMSDVDVDWNKLIHLYDISGKEIQVGKDGSFFGVSGGIGPNDYMMELDSYDLIDPAEVAEIEIDGVRYPFP